MRYFVLSIFAICSFFIHNDYNNLVAQQTRAIYAPTKATLARNAYKSKIEPSQRTILHINDIVNEREVIRTVGRDSYAAILLSGNLALRMSSYTTIEIEKMYNRSSEWEIDLKFGEIIVAASDIMPAVIKVDDNTIGSMGAVFAVSHNVERNTTIVSVLSGSVVVNGTTVDEFYTMEVSSKSISQFGTAEKKTFANVENIPGISNIANIGNFSKNNLALKQNKITYTTTPVVTEPTTAPTVSETYDDDGNEAIDYEYEVTNIEGVVGSADTSEAEKDMATENVDESENKILVASEDASGETGEEEVSSDNNESQVVIASANETVGVDYIEKGLRY